MSHLHVRLTKCYLIQILNEDDYEVDSTYYFGDRAAAMDAGNQMKEQIINQLKEEDKQNEENNLKKRANSS